MPTTLLSIPAELQKEIAACMQDDKDIIQLRQTCREMCAASHDTFVERFFTKRTVLYTKQGLQQLHEISQQKHLVAKLNGIDFITLMTRSIVDANPRPELALDYMHICQKIREATQYGEDEMSFLIRILDNLGAVGSRPVFKLLEHKSDSYTRLAKIPGLSKLSDGIMKVLANQAIVSPGSWSYRQSNYCPLMTLSHASASSKARITGLNFANYGPSIFSLGAQMSDETIARSWSGLKYLSIPLQEREYWPKMDIQLPRFLKAATALEKLELTFQCGIDNADREYALRLVNTATTNHELCSVSIIGYVSSDPSSQDLSNFLGNHRESLRNLKLQLVGWLDDDAFHNFVEWIASSFALDSVELGYIDIHPDNDLSTWLMVDDEGSQELSFRNGETIPQELRKLRERVFFYPMEESDIEEEDEDQNSDESIVATDSVTPAHAQNIPTTEPDTEHESDDGDDFSGEYEEDPRHTEHSRSTGLAYATAVESGELVDFNQGGFMADEEAVQRMFDGFE